MENYLGLIEIGLFFLVLIGIAVIELVRLKRDNNRKSAEAERDKTAS
jgi:hypothetical protein